MSKKNPISNFNSTNALDIYNQQLANAAPRSNQLFLQDQDYSKYDEGLVIDEYTSYDDVYENRAQNQSAIAQIGNGVLKGGVLAGTTFADTFGGTLFGIINAASTIGTDRSALDAFVDNSFSRAMQDINNSMEDTFANYRSREEQNMGLLEKMTTANFWGDTFIKNLGFATGAMLAGNLTTAAFGSLGRAAAISKRAGIMDDVAKSIVAEGKAANVDEAIKMLDNPELLKTTATGRSGLYEQLKTDSKALRNWNLANQITSNSLASVGEARLEALGNADEYKQKRIQELNEQYQGEIPQQELDKLNQELGSFRNAEFITNFALLSASNFIGYKDVWAKNYDLNSRGIRDLIDVSKLGKAFATKESTYKTLSKALLESGREGVEELSQTALQFGIENWVRAGNSKDVNLGEFINNLSEGVGESMGKEGLESFVVGTLTGMLGVPGFKADSKFKIGLNGGIIQEFKQANENFRNATEAANNINNAYAEFVKDHADNPEAMTSILMNMVRRDVSFDKAQEEALKTGDRYMYETLKSEKMFNLMNAYIEAGKFENFISMIDDETKLPVADIINKYAVPDTKSPDGKRNYFEGKKDEEILEFIRDKASKTKKAAESLRDTQDLLETKFGRQFAMMEDQDGRSTKVAIKTLLSRHLFLGEELDSRIDNLYKEVVPSLLKLINKKDSTLDNADMLLDVMRALDNPENLEELLKDKQTTKTVLALANVLDQNPNLSKEALINGDSLKDLLSLLRDRQAHNRAWIQLTENDFSKLKSELQETEEKIKTENAKSEAKADDFNSYLQFLSDEQKRQGYIRNDKNELIPSNPDYDKTGYTMYFNLDGQLYGVKQGVIFHALNNKKILNKDGEIAVWNEKFIRDNRGKIEILNYDQAHNARSVHQILKSNTIKLRGLELLLSKADNLKTKLLKKQAIELKLDELQLIEAADGIVDRKRFEKRLDNLKQLLEKVNKQIGQVDTTLKDIQEYIDIVIQFKNDLIQASEEYRNYSFNEKRDELSQLIKEEYDSIQKFIDSDSLKDLDTAYAELSSYKEDLEDRKKTLEEIIEDLENKVELSDALFETINKDLDKTYIVRGGELAFYKKWKGVTNEIKTGGSPFKLTKRIKYAITRYAIENGMDRKEAMAEYLEDLKKLDNDINESKNLNRNRVLYKEQLYLNKQELEEINSKLNSIKDAFGENLNERKNEYISLEKTLSKIDKIIDRLKKEINVAIKDDIKRNKVNYSQLNNELDINDDLSKEISDFEQNRLSLELFRSTNLVEQYDKKKAEEQFKYQTIYDDNGYPILTENQSALDFNDFLNNNVKQLRTEPKNKVRVFKVNDPNTPDDINTVLINTIESGGGTVSKNDYAIVITDLNGNPIKENGRYVYTFLPLLDKAVNRMSEVGAVLRYLKLTNEKTDLSKVRNIKLNNSYIPKGEKEITWKELVNRSREYTAKVYIEFLEEIDANLSKGVLLSISDVTNGFTFKQRTKSEDGLDEKFKFNNPIKVLADKLGNDVIGFKNNKTFGFRIEQGNSSDQIVSSKAPVKSGHSVMVLDNGDIIPIRGRKLKDIPNAVDTILHLISLANIDEENSKYGLTNLSVSLPTKKDSNDKMTEDGDTKIKVFGNKGLISRLIYWGKNPNSPNEIYIQNGEVIFKVLTTGGETYRNVSIKDIKNPEKNKELVNFLENRYFNLNKVHINKKQNLIYFHPVFKDGKLDFEFVNGYQNYIFENNMVEANMADNRNPNIKNRIFANKTVIFAENKNGVPLIENIKNEPKPTTDISSNATVTSTSTNVTVPDAIYNEDYKFNEITNNEERQELEKLRDDHSELKAAVIEMEQYYAMQGGDITEADKQLLESFKKSKVILKDAYIKALNAKNDVLPKLNEIENKVTETENKATNTEDLIKDERIMNTVTGEAATTLITTVYPTQVEEVIEKCETGTSSNSNNEFNENYNQIPGTQNNDLIE